jgi:hypothetical protein
MAFETPISVADAVRNINDRKYVLPSIQREFVWKPDQIVKLFDSLLKGYPIGSFLFWMVPAARTSDYAFYHFVQDYHERDARHNQKAVLTGANDVTAVLDGQQRLTALFIGLCGTYAFRKPRVRKTNPNAYPRQRLYVCLTKKPEDPEMEYDLRFRESTEDFLVDDAGDTWFRVGTVMGYSSPFDIIQALQHRDLGNNQLATKVLSDLYRHVVDRGTVSAYLEKAPDLDKVLSIFVRVNSGGTVLSYSDLLLSIATAEWKDTDAREAIYLLVDDLNKVGQGFAFTKDFVLKTCLMLADFETRFSTANFSTENMRVIEERWPRIRNALHQTAQLLASFGLSSATIPSSNAVVPIAYYLAQQQNGAAYLTSSSHKQDRERIRRWLLTALLKRTFTGQPDSVLRAVREVLASASPGVFPAATIVHRLDLEARDMRVTDTDLDRMLEEDYNSGYVFPTLALLYPWLDFANQFHIDHVHPRSKITLSQLKKSGMSDADAREESVDRRDSLANLQLLQGHVNQSKSDLPFGEWYDAQFSGNPSAAAAYGTQHFIPNVGRDLTDFIAFTDARRELLKHALRKMLVIPGDADE